MSEFNMMLDFQYTTTIGKLWSALTESNKLGVNLHFEQRGITNPQAFEGTKHGWTHMGSQLEKLLQQ
ncbi:hypothetical protein P9847_04495 [Paenibacillus chibensis]|uniref:Activator of Hsp90 ATPase 1 family protein n=1 Tax=Paenibacillus chibensis TaxID=59846 RepID=A0ABU6PR05_9BACL|nr:hypothetical protein [Paenibacillus chibensis]